MKYALRALLEGDAEIAALASGGIDWLSRGQLGGPAFITLQQIGGAQGQTHDGPDGLLSARVQVDCWADAASEAEAMATVVRVRLNGHRDENFQGIFHLTSRDGRDDLDDGNEAYRVSMDFMVHHKEGR